MDLNSAFYVLFSLRHHVDYAQIIALLSDTSQCLGTFDIACVALLLVYVLCLVKSRMRTAESEPGLICSLFSGASAYATGKGPGKENRGQSRKQKKSKEDENKSSCSLMAESMVASLQSLNMQLEEQQRQKQRASKNGASGDVSEEKSEDSVTRDTGSVVSDDCASSRKLSKNGYK